MDDSDGVTIESLAGIRLIRTLGHGDRAEVLLVRLRDGVGDSAALKVYRQHVDRRSISAEIEALSRAQGRHVVTLRDLTTTQDAVPALLLDRLARGSLGSLMRSREHLRTGEAITILAPLARALDRVHRAGAVHAGIRSDTVLFDAAGTPVLACFGRAFPIARELPPAQLAAQPGVALDLTAFAALSRAVLAQVDDPGMRVLSDFAEPGPALESHEWLERFSDRLFDAGEACAVEFPDSSGVTPDQQVTTVPLRALGLVSVSNLRTSLAARSVQITPTAQGVQSASPAVGRLPVLGAVVGAISEKVPGGVLFVLTRLVAMLRTVRMRWWLTLAAVCVVVVAALVLIPTRQEARQPALGPTASAAPERLGGAEAAPTSSDDPVAALVALLGSRERCIAQLSVLCLDAVDQSGSAALASDQALVRALQSGAAVIAAWGVDAARMTVVERLGNSALVAVTDPAETEPASILLMKGEAGWRIRDYLAR